MLVHFLLYKYKMKEPLTEAEILKVINKKYKEQFPEILKRTTERLELVFGLELKEVDPSSHSYTFVSKVGLPTEGRLSDGVGFPKNGLLMPLLGGIFMNGNGATEEETWEFLNVKLITKDLVQEKHLEYRQGADRDAPCYKFLWGPRGHAEASKMKVLEFGAEVSNTVYPSAFQGWYEEALRDEEERGQARVATQAATGAPASACSKATSSSPPQPYSSRKVREAASGQLRWHPKNGPDTTMLGVKVRTLKE
ncbi:hypothetical protein GH733_019226 [Mirounga leonina]|nr:hypothetical protein GH733_019226 [Mirounga leonina]